MLARRVVSSRALWRPSPLHRIGLCHPAPTIGIRFTKTYFQDPVQAPPQQYTTQILVPQKPFWRRAAGRILRFGFTAVFFTIVGAMITLRPLGDYLKYMVAPPTDAQTLTLYHPAGEQEEQAEAMLNNLPVVLALRQDPDYTEGRPLMKLPAGFRAHSLTGGALLGPGKITVPPLAFMARDGKNYIQVFHIGTDVCGYIGIVHGGLLATFLDEGLARACFPSMPNKIAMTAQLDITYKKPARADQFFVLRATTVKVEGRKAWVEGHIETLATKDGEPEILATAKALYIEPRQAKQIARAYPAVT